MKPKSIIVNDPQGLYDVLTAERPLMPLANAQKGFSTFTDDEYENWPGDSVEEVARTIGVDGSEFLSVFEAWGYTVHVHEGTPYVTLADLIKFLREQIKMAMD